MSEKKLYDFYTDRLNELDKKLVDKAIKAVNKFIPKKDKKMIIEAVRKNKYNWSSPYHFQWGMWCRNQFREHVCSDNKLPTGNWDDYYVPLVELALGIRKEGKINDIRKS